MLFGPSLTPFLVASFFFNLFSFAGLTCESPPPTPPQEWRGGAKLVVLVERTVLISEQLRAPL